MKRCDCPRAGVKCCDFPRAGVECCGFPLADVKRCDCPRAGVKCCHCPFAGVKGTSGLGRGDVDGRGKGGNRDPRERVKQEEQDGIVLSPQRRSFGTGR